MAKKAKPLQAKELYRVCDPRVLSFRTTSELEPWEGIVGQPRAMSSIQFGVRIQQRGYNIFVLGPAGLGKRTSVREFVEEEAKQQARPLDLCYVHNFEDAHKPCLLQLPAGEGTVLRQDMRQLVQELRLVLPTVFESESYQSKRHEVEVSHKEKTEKQIEKLHKQAKKRGITFLETPMGLVLGPSQKGKILTSEEFDALPKRTRDRLEKALEKFQTQLREIMRQVPQWERERRDAVEVLNREFSQGAIQPIFAKLFRKYKALPQVQAFLQRIQEEVSQHIQEFLEEEKGTPPWMGDGKDAIGSGLRRYGVNVFVEHAQTQGAPVVFEDNPTFPKSRGACGARISYGCADDGLSPDSSRSFAPSPRRVSRPGSPQAFAPTSGMASAQAFVESGTSADRAVDASAWFDGAPYRSSQSPPPLT